MDSEIHGVLRFYTINVKNDEDEVDEVDGPS